MHYRIFGPYKVAKNQNNNVVSDQESLWKIAEKDCPGIKDARGIYIFGFRSSGGKRIYPWYVGKSGKSSLYVEAFHRDKVLKYIEIVDGNEYARYTPFIFFVPRFTEKGRISNAESAADIDKLEEMLIELCLRANPHLHNSKSTKMIREMVVPGVLNSPKRGPFAPEIELKNMLGIN